MLLLWETFNLNELVHKSDDHEITEKLIVAIVSEDHKYDHGKENTAAGLSYLNVLNNKHDKGRVTIIDRKYLIQIT